MLNEPYVNTYVNPHFIPSEMKALVLSFMSNRPNSELKNHLTLRSLSDVLSQNEDLRVARAQCIRRTNHC